MKSNSKPGSSNQYNQGERRLFPQQVPHYRRMMKILDEVNSAVLDSSPTGAGKTYTMNAMAKDRGLALLIVAPKGLHSKHAEVADIFGNTLIAVDSLETQQKVKSGRSRKALNHVITIQSLAGRGDSPVNHPFLIKIKKGQYEPSEHFMDLVDQGILLVLDESQSTKNPDTANFSAFRTLSKYIIQRNKEIRRKMRRGEVDEDDELDLSRVLLMSATPADKQEHVLSIAQLLGLVESDRYFDMPPRVGETIVPTGILEMYNLALKRDPQKARELEFFGRWSKAEVIRLAYNLFTQIFRRFVASQMPKPETSAKKEIYNGEFHLFGEDLDLFLEGQAQLKRALRYDEGTGEIDHQGQDSFALVTPALIKIQKAKVGAIARRVLSRAKKFPKKKFIVALNYKDQMRDLQERLESLGAVLLHGEIKLPDRDAVVSQFQADSDRVRVIIIHPEVGGVGIDLDDKIGNRPREMYVMPDFKFIPLVQTLGRAHRMDTKSDVLGWFVYAVGGEAERKILEKLVAKKLVTSSIVFEADPEMFPGNYVVDVEDEDEIDESYTM